jgi:hypothetical protein
LYIFADAILPNRYVEKYANFPTSKLKPWGDGVAATVLAVYRDPLIYNFWAPDSPEDDILYHNQLVAVYPEVAAISPTYLNCTLVVVGV